MRLNEVTAPNGSRSLRRRIGRGNGSGRGTTAGKGTKGQKARSGGAKAFYRGMSSRMQRYGKLPGFNNKWRTEYYLVQVNDLNRFPANTMVNASALRSAGLIRGKRVLPVKVLGSGELSVPLMVHVDRITQRARERVEAAGGSVETTSRDENPLAADPAAPSED